MFKSIKPYHKKYKNRKFKSISRLKKDRLKEFANKLNENLPKSEVWFQDLYVLYKHSRDRFNKPLGNYIPDVLNTYYKYVIEIDGSIHNTSFQQKKDMHKTCIYTSKGYKVFRIKANDINSFNENIKEILKYREQRTIKGP